MVVAANVIVRRLRAALGSRAGKAEESCLERAEETLDRRSVKAVSWAAHALHDAVTPGRASVARRLRLVLPALIVLQDHPQACMESTALNSARRLAASIFRVMKTSRVPVSSLGQRSS